MLHAIAGMSTGNHRYCGHILKCKFFYYVEAEFVIRWPIKNKRKGHTLLPPNSLGGLSMTDIVDFMRKFAVLSDDEKRLVIEKAREILRGSQGKPEELSAADRPSSSK